MYVFTSSPQIRHQPHLARAASWLATEPASWRSSAQQCVRWERFMQNQLAQMEIHMPLERQNEHDLTVGYRWGSTAIFSGASNIKSCGMNTKPYLDMWLRCWNVAVSEEPSNVTYRDREFTVQTYMTLHEWLAALDILGSANIWQKKRVTSGWYGWMVHHLRINGRYKWGATVHWEGTHTLNSGPWSTTWPAVADEARYLCDQSQSLWPIHIDTYIYIYTYNYIYIYEWVNHRAIDNTQNWPFNPLGDFTNPFYKRKSRISIEWMDFVWANMGQLFPPDPLPVLSLCLGAVATKPGKMQI